MNKELTEERIRELVKEGRLIPYEKIFNAYPKEKQERIKKGSREIIAAMELRKLRKKQKLSQQALAEKMKVKREAIARIESGKQNVTLETLYRIADATGTELYFTFR